MIRNFSKIVALFTSILQITSDETLSTQVTENKKNQSTSASASCVGGGSTSSRIGKSIENLSTIAKSAKFKKPKITNFEMEFFTLKAKKPLYTYKRSLLKH